MEEGKVAAKVKEKRTQLPLPRKTRGRNKGGKKDEGNMWRKSS